MARRKPKKRTTRRIDTSLPVYQIKVSLDGSEPVIWRRLLVEDASLVCLHRIIQTAMGWEGVHLASFDFGDAEMDDLRPLDRAHPGDETLGNVVAEGHTTFSYTYDFGDGWQHTIEVEESRPLEPGLRYPRCIGGERACPFEDCGGIYGYLELLAGLEAPDLDPDHPLWEWADEDFDPERFDLDGVNEDLERLRPDLGPVPLRYSPEPRFSVGQSVRVKPDTPAPGYPDIPLGGCVGEVKKYSFVTPMMVRLRWSDETQEKLPEVYRKRCRRDERSSRFVWLDEDCLEPAPDGPVTVQAPEHLVVRPLSMDDPEDRVRAVFGLTSDDPLPAPTVAAHETYRERLRKTLRFPFDAKHRDFLRSELRIRNVSVLSLDNGPIDAEDGVKCLVRSSKGKRVVPLTDLDPDEEDIVYEAVDEYQWWVCSYESDFDPEEDDEEELPEDEYGDDFDDEDDDEFDDYEEDDWDEDEDEDEDWDEGEGPFDLFGQPPLIVRDLGGLDECLDWVLSVVSDRKGSEPRALVVTPKRPGRDEPCPCGSGKRYGRCCARRESAHPPVPFGTIALYGPDDRATTKIAAGVFHAQGEEPVMQRWVASDVLTSAKVRRELIEFLEKHGVRALAAMDRNIGCPHEEGSDFPEGGDCPFCPFWKGKQGSGAPE